MPLEELPLDVRPELFQDLRYGVGGEILTQAAQIIGQVRFSGMVGVFLPACRRLRTCRLPPPLATARLAAGRRAAEMLLPTTSAKLKELLPVSVLVTKMRVAAYQVRRPAPPYARPFMK